MGDRSREGPRKIEAKFSYQNYESLTGKGLKAMNILLHNVKHLNLKPSLLMQLFDALVGSTLNFSCEVNEFGKKQKNHLKYSKRILNVKSSTCNMGVYGELGRHPLFINRFSRIAKYWYKIIETDNILIKYIYT